MVTDLDECVILPKHYDQCNITMTTTEAMMTSDYNSTASIITDAITTTAAHFLQ